MSVEICFSQKNSEHKNACISCRGNVGDLNVRIKALLQWKLQMPIFVYGTE